MPLGSTGAPSYTFIGDLNTGFFSPGPDNIGFSTAGALRMNIDHIGNVGIGTPSPGERLTVAGIVHSTIGGFRFPDGTLQTTAGGGTGPGGTLPTGTASQTLRHDGTNWVANSNIFNDGTNVGIGMTAPAERLDVAGNVRAVDVRWGAGGSRGIHLADGFDLNNLTDAGWYDVNNAANRPPVAYGWTRVMVTRGHSPMWVHQQASDLHRDRMWHRRSWYAGGGVRAWGPWQEIWDAEGEATFTGNVGIGTTAPTARLHVAGTSRFDGVVDMTNHRITNLPPPIAASDAATRAYVDAAGAAISFELSCGWITTGNPPAVGTCSPPACPAGFSAAPVGCMVSAIISPPAAALDGAAHGRAYRPSGWWSVTGGSGTWGAGGAAGSCVVVCFR